MCAFCRYNAWRDLAPIRPSGLEFELSEFLSCSKAPWGVPPAPPWTFAEKPMIANVYMSSGCLLKSIWNSSYLKNGWGIVTSILNLYSISRFLSRDCAKIQYDAYDLSIISPVDILSNLTSSLWTCAAKRQPLVNSEGINHVAGKLLPAMASNCAHVDVVVLGAGLIWIDWLTCFFNVRKCHFEATAWSWNQMALQQVPRPLNVCKRRLIPVNCITV